MAVALCFWIFFIFDVWEAKKSKRLRFLPLLLFRFPTVEDKENPEAGLWK